MPDGENPTGNEEALRASLAPSARPELWPEPRGIASAEAARRCGARGPGVPDARGLRAAAATPQAPLRLWPAATPHLVGPPSGRALSCAPRSGPSWPAPATKVEQWGAGGVWGELARRGLEVRGSRRADSSRRGLVRTPDLELTCVLGFRQPFPLSLLSMAALCDMSRGVLGEEPARAGWRGWEVGTQSGRGV